MMVFRMVYNGESIFLLNNKLCLGLKAIHAKRKNKWIVRSISLAQVAPF